MQGFPTIKVLRPGKGSKGEVVDYTGGRTAKDIVDFALKQAAQVPCMISLYCSSQH